MSEPVACRLRWRGQVQGPVPWADVMTQLREHRISVYHEVEVDGAWTPLKEVLDRLARERVAAPPARPVEGAGRVEPGRRGHAMPPGPGAAGSPPPRGVASPVAGARRSRKLFVAAGLLLGFLGVHNFYAGYRGTALVQCVVTVILATLGFGIFASWVWAWIELVVVHTDARGHRLV